MLIPSYINRLEKSPVGKKFIIVNQNISLLKQMLTQKLKEILSDLQGKFKGTIFI